MCVCIDDHRRLLSIVYATVEHKEEMDSLKLARIQPLGIFLQTES